MRNKKISLYDAIKEDLTVFRSNRDQKSLDALRVVLGELQRNPKKDYSDKSVLGQLRVLRKMTLKSPKPDYLVVSIIEHYLPEPVTTPEIRNWLRDNGYTKEKISELKNPLALIGIVSKEFKGRDVDGNMMKTLINNIMNGVDGLEEKNNIEKYLDVMTKKDC